MAQWIQGEEICRELGCVPVDLLPPAEHASHKRSSIPPKRRGHAEEALGGAPVPTSWM